MDCGCDHANEIMCPIHQELFRYKRALEEIGDMDDCEGSWCCIKRATSIANDALLRCTQCNGVRKIWVADTRTVEMTLEDRVVFSAATAMLYTLGKTGHFVPMKTETLDTGKYVECECVKKFGLLGDG